MYANSNSAELLGAQVIGIVSIGFWAVLWSMLFCHIAQKGGHLRLSEEDEILGGDLYYFGPAEYNGDVDELRVAIANMKGKLTKEVEIMGL